jgi:hypothetical protein
VVMCGSASLKRDAVAAALVRRDDSKRLSTADGENITCITYIVLINHATIANAVPRWTDNAIDEKDDSMLRKISQQS